MASDDPEGVKAYKDPAGGWGAARPVTLTIRSQMEASTETRALLQMNQSDGFDCMGCTRPDPRHASSFEFCENGAKAVPSEATAKRVDPDFFARRSLAQLWTWSDYALADAGRLTHPLLYDGTSGHLVPIAWGNAKSTPVAIRAAQ